MTPSASAPARTTRPDAVLTAAVDVARDALLDLVDPDQVGEYCGVVAEEERVATHRFVARMSGYAGWCWAVTVTRAPRQKAATVDEVVLLPGDSALVAPAWLPWKERMAAADLGPGDLIPVPDDDPRLVPGYLVGDQDIDPASARDIREVTREVGLGRERVLSVEGREEAAERWHDGPHGPDDPIAKEAPARCLTCGFLVRMSGPLNREFGVCANALSPSDGHVVSYDHGCGAHSDVREEGEHGAPTPTPYHDTLSFDTWDEAEVELIR